MDTVGKKLKKSRKEKPFFPDEIITNILVRLPIKGIIRCTLVCKRWKEITRDRDFMDSYERSRKLVILVTDKKNVSNPFALDKWWESARTRFKILKFPFDYKDFVCGSRVLYSHAGLIVLGDTHSVEPKFFILNPAIPGRGPLKITLSQEIRKSNFCAVYYHPSLKEYCSLWKVQKSAPFSGHPILDQYMLLILNSEPSLKMISSPFNYPLKTISSLFSHPLKYDKSPALFIDNYLFWMLESTERFEYSGRNDILEFNILSEEFKVISCPVPLNTICVHYHTRLLNSDGILSFLLMSLSTITIWRLDVRVEQVWTPTEYAIDIKIRREIHMIGAVNGFLYYHARNKLFICNLLEGTVKNYPKMGYKGDVSYWSHQMSLVSLKDCKSALFIDKDCKVLVKK